MKKNILLLTLVLGFFMSNAQSIEFRMDSLGTSVNGDTITKNGSVTNPDLEQHMWVAQTSGSAMDIKAKVYVQFMDTGRYTVCWFQCYAPQLPSVTYFNPTDIVTVQTTPGSVSNFSAHYYHTSGAPATICQMRYVLYDDNNPSDSAYVDIVFDNNPTSIDDLSLSDVKLNAYPNPATDNLTIAYDIKGALNDASLSVYDVLGQEVIAKELNENKGTVRLNLEAINSGVYFYAISVAGKAVRTERFIVR
jgi:hypothetical protein